MVYYAKRFSNFKESSDRPMIKKYKTVYLLLGILVMTGFYKSVIHLVCPELSFYPAKLIEEALQAITVIAFISWKKLWGNVGVLTKVNRKSILFMLPIIIVSFMPMVSQRLKTDQLVEIVMIAVISLLIGFSEEMSCRGVLLQELKHLGKASSIITSSVIFGCLHMLNLLKGVDIGSTIIQIIFAVGFGLTMAIVRYETSFILPQILVHALWDFNSKISDDTNLSARLELLIWLSLVIVVLWGIFLYIRKRRDRLI
ncbi:CPBP family intramembrane glutamic endopeptidase [Anaeromicropila populeti]|nr:CPBP family intramembrane glutamic endopeptidase [Anaeromicropila populeti]